MTEQSLWVKIPEIICIPLVALVIITFIKAATGRYQIGPEVGVDIGMDIAVLATGACGSIFANETLSKKWPVGLPLYGILTVLICISFIAYLSWVRRFQEDKGPVTWDDAKRNAIVGLIPLGLVTALLILGYILS